MPSTNDASTVLPACLLSNGRYTVMTSATGSGFSRWCGLSLTRWREDATAPTDGSYLIVRDTAGGLPWSVTAQPFGFPAPAAGLRLSNGHAQYRRRRGALAATLAVAVLPDIDGELRSLVLRNAGATARTVDVTTYTELVLGAAAADAAHPAFSKLFIETDWDAQRGALLATRRRRSPDESPVWIAHHVVVDPADADGGRSAESDRARFLGRGRPLSRANALNDLGALSGTVGAVLDPVFSLRCRVRVEPGAHVRLNAWTVVASTREGALAACDATRTAAARERAFADAGAHERDVASGLGIGAAERAQFQRMIAPLLTADPAWRARPDAIAGGTGGAPVLWAHGISGDRAIVLVEARDDAGAARAARTMLAQRYWQALGLGVDVVVLAADGVRPAVDAAASAQRAQPAGVPAAAVFVLAEREVTDTLRRGLAAAARIVRDVPLPDAGAAPLAERAGR
ncbi:MAG: glycosyl transferase family 36, partial [Betaproteobacteria bacterium]